LRRNWERQGVLGAGDPIPSFQVTTVEARQLSSEAMRGKIVLIDFWSTTCGACLQDMPIIRAVHERFRESGFEVMGVAFDQNAQAVRRAAQAKKALWPQVLASQAGELPEKMGARGTPYYVLVDSRGRLASPGIGIRFLEDRVEQLLAERAR
ncbi:MAG TPA: TlpA disulfide reductase family protein, partial [Acidobacteriota bacterium]|nr:TlpA disulfide reductase family protein [Acidobacteriota bacterium]